MDLVRNATAAVRQVPWPWPGRSAEQRVDEALSTAQAVNLGGVIPLEQALVLLVAEPSIVQHRLPKRPPQLEATAQGSLLFYEVENNLRRKFSREVQQTSDTWINAGGKCGKLRVQVPPRLVDGQEDLELVIRRGHVAVVPPRSERRSKYVQFTLRPSVPSGAGATSPGPWSSDRLQALAQRQLFQVLRPASTQRSNISEQLRFVETEISTASSDDDNAPAQLPTPPTPPTPSSEGGAAPFEELESCTTPLELDTASGSSDLSPPSESSEPELTPFGEWVWDAAANGDLLTDWDDSSLGSWDDSSLGSDCLPGTYLDTCDDSFETGSEPSVSTEQAFGKRSRAATEETYTPETEGSHSDHFAGAAENPGANRSDGVDRSLKSVEWIDANAVLKPHRAYAPTRDPEQLRRKLAKMDVSTVFAFTLSCVACSAILLTNSSPMLSSQTLRKLSDTEAANSTSSSDDGCSWLYHNTHDEQLLVGDFELRQFFIRGINLGHPLLLPFCVSTPYCLSVIFLLQGLNRTHASGRFPKRALQVNTCATDQWILNETLCTTGVGRCVQILNGLITTTVCTSVGRAIQFKMLELSGRTTVDENEFPLVTTAGNVLSEKHSALMELSFSACIRLVPKLLIFGHFASIAVVGIASTRFPLVLTQASLGVTMVLKGSQQPIVFTMVYRLVGFSMVPVGMELTDLALRVWSACVPSTTVNQVYMTHQIGSVQVGPVAIDVGTMDVGFGALILVLTALSGCLSLATRAALAVGLSGWLIVRGYCELIYWLAATTSSEETCLGNALGDVAEVWGGYRYLFMMSLSTAFLVAVGSGWSRNALGNFAEHRSSLPTSERPA